MNRVGKLTNEMILNYFIVLYSFSIPLSRAGIGVFSFLIMATWLFKNDKKKDIGFILNSKSLILLILFLFFSAISLLWSSNLDEGYNYLVRYWYFLPVFIIATNLKKEFVSITISTFLIAMLISEILSYGMFFEIINISNPSSPFPTPFMNHLQYSAFVVFTALILLNKIYYTSVIKEKILYFIFFLTVTINIFINGGRIGYMAFFIVIFIVLFLNIKDKLKAFLLSAILIISSIYLAYSYSPTFQKRLSDTKKELVKISNKDFSSSFGQRLAMIYIGTQIVLDTSLLGVGIGDEMDVLKEYVNSDYPELKILNDRRHFHNIFLHITVQLGIVGLVLLLVMFYYLLKVDISNRYILNIKYIFLSVYLVTSLTGNMFHQQFTMALFTLIVAIILTQNRIENNQEGYRV